MTKKGRPRIYWCRLTHKIRHRAGLSQKQLASLLGVSQPTVSHWEIGAIEPTHRLKLRLEALA